MKRRLNLKLKASNKSANEETLDRSVRSKNYTSIHEFNCTSMILSMKSVAWGIHTSERYVFRNTSNMMDQGTFTTLSVTCNMGVSPIYASLLSQIPRL